MFNKISKQALYVYVEDSGLLWLPYNTSVKKYMLSTLGSNLWPLSLCTQLYTASGKLQLHISRHRKATESLPLTAAHRAVFSTSLPNLRSTHNLTVCVADKHWCPVSHIRSITEAGICVSQSRSSTKDLFHRREDAQTFVLNPLW